MNAGAAGVDLIRVGLLARPHAHAADDTPRLARRFALYSGLVLVVAAAGALLLARHNATVRAQDAVWADARFVADRLGRDDLAGSAFGRPAGADVRAQLDALFGGGLLGPDTLRVKLFAPDGTVTYSTDHALIGRSAGDAARARRAAAGRAVHADGTLAERGRHERVLASYVPVRWLLSTSSRPTGVLAVYRDYRPVARTIRHDFLVEAGVVALALLLLYAASFPIMRRVTATLAYRHRRLLEQAAELAASESRYRTMMEQASDGILVRGGDGRYVDANARACELLGYPRDELLGLAAADVEASPAAEAELREGSSLLEERAYRRKDGSLLDAEVHERLLTDGRVLSSLRDVSDRKRAEAALRRLATVVETSTDAIFGTDEDGVVTSWNPAAEETFGWTAEEIVGRSAATLLAPDRDDELPLLLERLWRGEHVSHYGTVSVRKDGGPIDVLLTLAPIHDERGRIAGVSATARDVTERKRLGEELRQTQRVEAVTRLAAGVGAELGALVERIEVDGARLLAQLPPDEPLRETVESLRRQAERVETLTGQLLAFGRRRPRDERVLDLNELLGKLEPALAPLVGHGIGVEVDAAPALGRVRLDAAQLEHAVLALAANARDAMPGGGTLTLSTTNVDLEEDVARPHLHLRPGRYVLLTVRDTDVGMDDEALARAFDPFFTTKPGEAKGLGLATVHGIVEQSGGAIGVDSASGRGATFRIWLPRVEDAAEPVARPEAPPRGTETVLVVDDEPLVRELVARALGDCGYRVLPAASAGEALELCEREAGPVDLLLTDMVLPEIGGRELAERVTALRPEASVVYASGFPDDVLEAQGQLDPGIAFVQKPFAQNALARRVREVLDRRGVYRHAEALARRHAA